MECRLSFIKHYNLPMQHPPLAVIGRLIADREDLGAPGHTWDGAMQMVGVAWLEMAGSWTTPLDRRTVFEEGGKPLLSSFEPLWERWGHPALPVVVGLPPSSPYAPRGCQSCNLLHLPCSALDYPSNSVVDLEISQGGFSFWQKRQPSFSWRPKKGHH